MPTIRTPRTAALAAATLALALAGAASPALAADVTAADVTPFFTMPQVDRNHDHKVSKKEFMDMMSKAWDMEAKKMGMAHDGAMTLEEYRKFAAMFNLDIGA